MAKITELTILNPSDKTRMYSVATGKDNLETERS